MIVDRRLLLMTGTATLFALGGLAGWIELKAQPPSKPSADRVAREMLAGETAELAGLTLSRSEYFWLLETAPGAINPGEIVDVLRPD